MNSRFISITALLCALNGLAVTHYVWQGSPTPTAPFTTWGTAAHDINSAVGSATGSDIVLVTDGFYQVDLTISLNEPVTLKSVNGAQPTIIDGSNAVRCVQTFTNATIDGFTLTNGTALGAGGAWLANGATIRNCIVVGNRSTNPGPNGGGLYCANGVLAEFCMVAGNFCPSGGGGVYCVRSTITDSVVERNVAQGYGGGIYLADASKADYCTITSNRAWSGGGLWSTDTNVVSNSDFLDNVALGGPGGGARLDAGGSVRYCTFVGNSATNDSADGGGVWMPAGGTLDAQFSGNVAGQNGGAVACWFANVQLGDARNNAAGQHGGAIWACQSTVMVQVAQNISDNQAELSGGAMALTGTSVLDVVGLNLRFERNVASNQHGGVIYADHSRVDIRANFSFGATNPLVVFNNNAAGIGGGALYAISGAQVTVADSLLSSNSAFTGGVAMPFGNSAMRMVNCVVAQNRTRSPMSAALEVGGASTLLLEYCTIADNQTNGVYASPMLMPSPGIAVVTNCIVWANTGSQIWGSVSATVYSDIEGGFAGTSNINANPLFVNSAALDYAIDALSPCEGTALDIGITNDIIDTTRPNGSGFDMGAYEVVPEPAAALMLIAAAISARARRRHSAPAC